MNHQLVRNSLVLLATLSITIGLIWFYLQNTQHQIDTANPIQEESTVGSNLVGSTTFVFSGREYTAYHPNSFQLEYLNSNLRNPRIIHFHNDRIFIGSKSGAIYWMDPPYSQTNILAKLGNYPHSMIIRDDELFVARTGGIYVANYDGNEKWIAEDSFELFVNLPGGPGHKSRTLKIGPDNKMYVSLGIRGNCSDEYLDPSYPEQDRRGGVYVIDESGDIPVLKPFASGLRNPVGFDWHPHTNVMYASNNGPDHLGFELPPEYFSEIREHSFHGMPWFQYDGESLIRDNCVKSDPPKPHKEVTIPAITLPPRNAPMDVAFIPDHANAKEYIGHGIVALHGSWGTAGDGSKGGDKASRRPPGLALVEFNEGQPIQVIDFISGFQSKNSGNRWARPVGVAVGPDGDIYFTSDDGAQGLFRLKKL